MGGDVLAMAIDGLEMCWHPDNVQRHQRQALDGIPECVEDLAGLHNLCTTPSRVRAEGQ